MRVADSSVCYWRDTQGRRLGLFTAHERRMEYRRRGKSPSGVIDGVYNGMNREGDRPYSDMDRDWDADA